MLSINYELANELSIDTSDEMQLVEYFSGNTVPKDAEAIAMAYAGHQFDFLFLNWVMEEQF